MRRGARAESKSEYIYPKVNVSADWKRARKAGQDSCCWGTGGSKLFQAFSSAVL